MAGMNDSNGVTTKQVLGVAGILLLAFVGGLVGMLLQGGKAQEITMQTLRLDMQDLKAWKDNWKPQVDAAMAREQALDKNVDALTRQMAELAKASQDLLAAVRTQKDDMDAQKFQAVRFQATLDRIESRITPRK